MDIATIGNVAGGIGLFLLGMHLMTQGLQQAAGRSLKSALNYATQSRWKGLLSGSLITALVQSSSAVTVATIGFVNAGLLSLGQSVAVIYGCNIGTTMTGWLVALIGFKIKISAFALPLIALGMGLYTAAQRDKLKHLGLALAGFGIFFVGLDFLKDSFTGLEDSLDLASFSALPLSYLLFVLAGFVLTFLMQSSSAAIAITLSLSASGAIDLTSAAALVIGANLGTTSTALLAVIGATANAKRIAAAHVAFNLITGAVGLVLLSIFAQQINQLNSVLDKVTLLALFHTVFNLLGVVLIWPLTDRLVRVLGRMFRKQSSDTARPRYLDDTVLETPLLAIEAMRHELARVSRLSTMMGHDALNSGSHPTIAADLACVNELVDAIVQFNQKVAQRNLDPEIALLLPSSLRIGRYLSEVAKLAERLAQQQQQLTGLPPKLQHQVDELKSSAALLLIQSRVDEMSEQSSQPAREEMKRIQHTYHGLKADILAATTSGQISAHDSSALLDVLSQLRRMAEQAEKAASSWSTLSPIEHRDAVAASA
ncbi:Na/Pi cotransporter family protein [Neptunomonas marina]|uniref:Na/Pi cotransporter family protein n=1 Tax=Neptunomonas marina TaxID=1815562 RepID=A0A437Q7C1_9GAMM|nr:Na/Pi cotransporter family protein [Neptunomonas marina]RVU30368.1 Na/Pi cotransporter family protein [Neptunomonas marina]